MRRSGKGAFLLTVAVLVAGIMLAQAAAFAAAPDVGSKSAGRVIGRTGFAYLAGLRTFGAAVLWNRLDPQFHEYYSHTKLREQVYILPTLRAVLALDPQFEQAYVLASYILATRGDTQTALEVARQGVENNPKSGLMRSNVIQVLIIEDPKKNLDEMLEQTRAGMSPGTRWANADDMYESLVAFRTVYEVAGDTARAADLSRRLQELKDSGDLTTDDHDHDGDGIQDH